MRHIRGTGRSGRTARAGRARRARRVRVASAAILVTVVLGLTTTACGAVVKKVAVRAIARGAPAAAPFFEEAARLAMDIPVSGALALGGGTKKGDRPGLYGGSRNKRSCAKNELVRFLMDPANRQKAVEWAEAQGIEAGEIEGFVKKLTPVLLRNDTLVKNHDFKKGRAVPFDALLEAGIAVLVDLNGRPVVQCSCGNPLGTFEHDVDRAEVEFKDRNKRWKSYNPEKIVKVEPTDTEDEVRIYRLVDVDRKDAGVARLPGTDGTRDEPLPYDPGEDGENPGTRVPPVTDMPVEEAMDTLTAQGFQVRTEDGPSGGAVPGTVLGQDPAADEQAPEGTTVTLTVAPEVTPSGTESPEVTPSGTESPVTTPSGTEPPSESPSPTEVTGEAMVTTLADAPVHEFPSSTSPEVSEVAAGSQYPATCYDYGPEGDTWVQLSLRSGGFGWLTATALQEDPAAGGLGRC
ncbi:DUF6777 domain-containing protein [Streptomyces sp. NPDC093094]|uniref:DUF6777 domain-containing protein n=1 Tax=Streptomyces sp. NPDC093094 TaxID=3366026 RepID=UPI00380B91D6